VSQPLKKPIRTPLSRPKPARWRSAAALVVLAIAAVLLFARLGHYALWDDEAGTALIGEGVWKTGDTSVVVGHNIMAFRDGAELTGLKARYLPPLQQYLAAPFVGEWPGSALAVRLPFAVLGFLTVAIVLWWMRRDNVQRTMWILLAMGMIGNVSFWLYCRQARYYSITMFLSVVIVYLYLHFENRWWVPAMIGAASALLIASSYLAYAALYGALGVDWLLWGRRRFRPSWQGWTALWAPQILLGVPVICIWYPFGGIWNRVTLFWWYLRDANRCEFGAILLIAAAPLLWPWKRDVWLLRAPLALLCYLMIVTLASPQKTWIRLDGQWTMASVRADVRYLCPIILLAVAIAALVIKSIVPDSVWRLTIPIGAIAFFTNALQGGALLASSPAPGGQPLVRLTFLDYAGELIDPPTDPYSVAAAWINTNVKEGQSILVLPDYMSYPLMFHAPKAVYAWQLDANKRKQYPTLPAIDFSGFGAPDYVIIFGEAAPAAETIHLPNHRDYEMVRMLGVYGQDLFRPEIFMRTFRPMVDFDPTVDGVRIYRRR
jgi:hypothetical protein